MASEIKYERKEDIDMFRRYYYATLSHPVRKHVTLEYFGNLTGKSVVDLGCNDGHFLMKCLGKGAEFCLGLDASNVGFPPKEKTEKEYGARLDFEVQDCFKPIKSSQSQFDFASSHGVLCLCKDEMEVENLCANAFNLIKPGGHFFTGGLPLVANTAEDQEILMDLCGSFVPLRRPDDPDPLIHEAYGLEPAPASTSKTGRPFTRQRLFMWKDYGWSKEKSMAILEKVGFTNVQLIPISFPDGVDEDEQQRLKSLKEPFIFIGAEKPKVQK